MKRNEMKTKRAISRGVILVSLPLLGTSSLCLYMSQPARLNSPGLWSFGMLFLGVAVITIGYAIKDWIADRRV